MQGSLFTVRAYCIHGKIPTMGLDWRPSSTQPLVRRVPEIGVFLKTLHLCQSLHERGVPNRYDPNLLNPRTSPMSTFNTLTLSPKPHEAPICLHSLIPERVLYTGLCSGLL